MELAARQLLRALRGPRSQLAFSRRLGYLSPVAAAWEAGRRSPTGDELLRAATRTGVDVPGALARFHPASAGAWSPGPEGLAAWLRALQGRTTQLELAQRTGLSRYSVGRALSGQTSLRLPDFLALVDALTGRAPDLVAELVDITLVPALEARWRASQRAARLAWDEPWSMAALMQVQVGLPAKGAEAALARALDIPFPLAERCLQALAEAGLAGRGEDGRWQVRATPSVQTPDPETHRAWVRAWGEVAQARAERPESRVNLNVFSVSRADLARIRAIQEAAFAELRGVVAASEPIEAVALVRWQLTELSAGTPER